jgi:hypothetical protein
MRFEDTAIVPPAVGTSPMRALASVVLPLPTGPEHMIIDPLLMSILTFVRIGGIDGVVRMVTFSIRIADELSR